MTTLLIDADGLAFRAAAAAEKTFKWDEDTISVTADIESAKDHFRDQIGDLMEAADANDLILCWSCPTRRYFRHDLLPAYKGHRKGTTPVLRTELTEWAQVEYTSKVKPRLEADDVVGILATHPKLVPGRKIIVSDDKDMLQIPGYHWRMGKRISVTQREADEWLWMQVLMGDPADGYKGIPKIGPKKATAILANRRPDETHLDAVLSAYLKAGLTKEYLACQINVARILQYTDYNFKTKEPRLWQM